ncbi:hypothetical protein GGF43_006372 [Coemansia sp. RSA 2618]|nr:hypothetical protein GGF43_006372 [Coemansia sp. RSA 2618]
MDTSDIAATDVDALPDSRSVVQGLLRSIPRPTSQPPQSAINRAKRNTVQISARGSVVDDSYVASPPTRPALTRSASTRATPDPASAPLEPAQALAHSASTLRPSSDTFTHDDSVPSSPHAALEDGSASPTESVETVSSHHESEDAGPAALTALAHSAPHRLKDAAVHAELSLDDWLVVLRGWGDMHDASSAFYRTLLRDIDSSDPVLADAHSFISGHVAALADSKSPVDDILSVSQGVGRRLDTLERELDDIARILVHAN